MRCGNYPLAVEQNAAARKTAHVEGDERLALLLRRRNFVAGDERLADFADLLRVAYLAGG